MRRTKLLACVLFVAGTAVFLQMSALKPDPHPDPNCTRPDTLQTQVQKGDACTRHGEEVSAAIDALDQSIVDDEEDQPLVRDEGVSSEMVELDT